MITYRSIEDIQMLAVRVLLQSISVLYTLTLSKQRVCLMSFLELSMKIPKDIDVCTKTDLSSGKYLKIS